MVEELETYQLSLFFSSSFRRDEPRRSAYYNPNRNIDQQKSIFRGDLLLLPPRTIRHRRRSSSRFGEGFRVSV